jgi:hypothetical protein
MGRTITAVDPTLGWTQSYGAASLRERAREAVRDAAFALAVLVCAAGAAGFLMFENPAPRYAQAAATRPAL